MSMNLDEIIEGFSHAGKLDAKKRNINYHYDEKEWALKGIANFKKRVLGWLPTKIVKSPDDLAEILTNMGVVNSLDDGKEIIKYLYGKSLLYRNLTGYEIMYANPGGYGLTFTKVQDVEGKEMCKVEMF